MAAKIPNDIFQYSTPGALSAGYSDHGPTVRDLPGYGSHGLGVFAGSSNDYLLLLRGKSYRLTPPPASTGSSSSSGPQAQQNPQTLVTEAAASNGLAFVIVTNFQPDYRATLRGEVKKERLFNAFANPQDLHSGGRNSFIPFTVTGRFAEVRLRNVAMRGAAFSADGDSDTSSSTSLELADVQGTISGFLGPEWARGISVSGFCAGFLGEDGEGGGRMVGGIVEEFLSMGDVEMSWAVTGRFHLGFPRGDAWEKLEIGKV